MASACGDALLKVCYLMMLLMMMMMMVEGHMGCSTPIWQRLSTLVMLTTGFNGVTVGFYPTQLNDETHEWVFHA